MSKYPFSFRVRGYNEDDETYYEQCGMGICSGYADAVHIIETRYGDELIAVKHLELYEEDDVIPMSYEIMRKIVVEYYDGEAMYETQISEEEARKL